MKQGAMPPAMAFVTMIELCTAALETLYRIVGFYAK